MKKFTPGEAIEFGWETMKKHFWFFVSLLIVSWLTGAVPTGIANGFKNKVAFLYVVFILGAWVIQVIVRMGLIKVVLDIIDKGTADLKTLFSQTQMFWKFLGGAVLYGLIVLGGFILLIVPGIIWGIKYQFFGYLIIDKNLGPIEALKKSGEITMGNKGSLFVLGLLLALINLLGVMCLIVGLFATIPLTIVAMTYVYRKLLGETVATESALTAPIVSTPTTGQPA